MEGISLKKLSVCKEDTLIFKVCPPDDLSEEDVGERIRYGLQELIEKVPCRVDVLKVDSDEDLITPHIRRRLDRAEELVEKLG